MTVPTFGASVAVQAGHVGMHLVRHLAEPGAKVFVADVNERRRKLSGPTERKTYR